MATTFVDYTGDGNATKQFTFPSIQESDIKVKVDEVVKSSGTHYNITGYTTTGGGNVVFTSGNIPTSPSVIHIYRDTNVDTAKATYTAGASVKAGDLNANHEQVLFALQEEQNQLERIGDIKDGSIDSAKIKDDTIVNADVNSAAAIAGTKISPNFGSQNIITTGTAATGAHTVTGNITVSGTVDGRDVATDGSKLDGIESGATADQTAAEIRTLVESATDSNVFTDADHTKLNGIETAATADQTAAEIRTLVENASDSNVFTDADHTKLNGIEAGATADQTNAEIRAAVEAATDSNVFTDADHSKLNAIEAGATADQSDAEIKTAYENNSDTNAFTDAEKTKLGNLGSLNALSDVNTSGVADGKILKYDASASEFIIADDGGSGSGGATAFTGLSDTPSNYGSAAGKTLKVNSSGNAIEFVTVSTDIVSDTTPQLGGNLDVQASEINTSTTNGNIKLTPNGTGFLEVKGNTNPGTIQLNCENNSHGVKIKGPAHSASASYTLTLPNDDGSANQVLKTDGSGNLSWVNQTTDTNTQLSNAEVRTAVEAASDSNVFTDADHTKLNGIATSATANPNALDNIVEDTSPQLGGELDTNNFDIKISDGEKLKLHDHGEIKTKTAATNAVSGGLTGYVLQHSTVIDSGSYDIWLSSTGGKKITFGTSDSLTHEVMRVQCAAVGASQHGFVNLNYVTANAGGNASSATKLQTTSTGVTVTGNVVLSNALLPSADSSSDIGTTSVRWRNVYADTLYGDGSNLTGISTTATVAGDAIYENSQTISSTHTIPTGSNGMSAGPVTVNNGVTLTISSGSTYTVV